jgi:predicted metal-dependent hydrolase
LLSRLQPVRGIARHPFRLLDRLKPGEHTREKRCPRGPAERSAQERCQIERELVHSGPVLLNFFAGWNRFGVPQVELLRLGAGEVPLHLVRNGRARRYVLRVRRDGAVRVTIPRGGSREFALEFVQQNRAWIEREIERRAAASAWAGAWRDGSAILLHGEEVRLTVQVTGELALVRFGEHVLSVPVETSDVRPAVENYLWSLAEEELPPRVAQLAELHQLTYRRVVIRSQRSRWGSCSPKQTISLNWRLIQAPPAVRDYMILHELMHLREMNHSARFWRAVEAACPDYVKAEAWLNRHSHLLR